MEKEVVMKKVIEIEFDDNFAPPAEFSKQDGSKCEPCPFFQRYEGYGAECSLLCDDRGKCPIKKFFN